MTIYWTLPFVLFAQIKHSFVADQPAVIANFLVTRKGISRQVLGEYLGSGSERTKKILKSLCNEIDLNGLDVDEALRKFQSHIRIQVSITKIIFLFFYLKTHKSNLTQNIFTKIILPKKIFYSSRQKTINLILLFLK